MTDRARKFRGYRRHGHGMKGRRGRGLRGGEGMSGLGKHRWIWLNKFYRYHWGRHGFVSHCNNVPDSTINIIELEQNLQFFENLGFAASVNNVWTVDLTGAGITKLLGKGTPTRKMNLKVEKASAQAIEKIKKAGGGVELDG